MAIGDVMPVFPGMTKTFNDDFTAGLAKWPNTKYPWARETNINGEQQYYSDQSGLLASDKTVRIVNDVLELRCIDTPGYYQNVARIVLNGYVILSSPAPNQIVVQGINYYDRDTFSNAVGIGWNPDAAGTIKIGNNPEQQYTSIGPLGQNAVITLAGNVPADLTLNDTNYRATVYRSQPKVSGMVTTQNTQANGNTGFSQKFGRWGARIRSPRGQFSFPAFWLWRDYEEINGVTFTNIQKSVEFDIWEILGHAPDISYHTLHSPGFDMRPNNSPLLGNYNGRDQWVSSHMQQHQIVNQSVDFSARFWWVYFDWFTDNTCAWYVENAFGDIIEVANARIQPTADDGTIDAAMMILNNAYGSDWSWNQSKQVDQNYERFVDETPGPHVLEVDEVCVWQFDGAQGGNQEVIEKRYTDQTVVGPEGTIDDVVIGLPSHETDRQGTVHEVEAKIAYRPVNITPDMIGLEWGINAPAPLVPVFVDGNNKDWRARVHLTTSDSSPLPEAIDCEIFVSSVFLK